MPDHRVADGLPHWLSAVDPARFPPPAEVPPRTGVVVIGGGLAGVATSYWLARSGCEVLLVEARELASGASGRNAGMALHGTHPIEDSALLESVLAREGIDAGYATTGHLALAGSAEVWERFRDEVASRPPAASPLRALDRTQCQDLLGMRVDTRFHGGRWLPDGRTVDPARLVYGLAGAARHHGAVVATGTEVAHVEPAGGRRRFVVRTSRGRVRSGHVVLACGVAATKFVPRLREVVDPVRGQMMATEPLPPVFPVAMAVDWGSVYWQQREDGTVVIGGCRSADPAENTTRDAVNPRIQHALAEFLPSAFPDVPTISVRRRWAGIMDCPRDGRPVIGALPEEDGRWIVAGFGGHGMPVGLGAGHALADAIASGCQPALLDPFSPNRFAELHRR